MLRNNAFKEANQLAIVSNRRHIPNLIIFVNSLPLVLFEFKNLFNQDSTIEPAFH
ncbi:type I restriction endonuclease [Rufibacter radiotolerans]|uniref:type I restriction endonuclease n=1 Tax=Rufibacter radiotolerans TaxID=1379910 RepID=UPI0009E40630|nr:type I restriction enzyme HsdR N-terminal domain-containing protein [Rufibacter radiotolerans]